MQPCEHKLHNAGYLQEALKHMSFVQFAKCVLYFSCTLVQLTLSTFALLLTQVVLSKMALNTYLHLKVM